ARVRRGKSWGDSRDRGAGPTPAAAPALSCAAGGAPMADTASTPGAHDGAPPARAQRLQIQWADLQAAAQAGDISPAQAERLWSRWSPGADQAPPAPVPAPAPVPVRFNFVHVLYYFGGLLAIGAMTLFMNLGWELFG